jgi:integrase
MSKARNGEGSIFPIKSKDGKITGYRVEMSLGFKPNGKRARTRRVVPTLKEAKDLRTRLAVEHMDGRLTIIHAETVATYGIQWVREVKTLQVRATTASDYEDRLRRWIVPSLGRIRLIDLKAGQVDAWMAAMRRQGLSASTINGARQVLNAICKHATRTGILAHNPVLATDPVKRQSTDRTQVREQWGLDEMWRVLDASRDHHLDVFLHLMLHTGMRPGEALGLRWEDVDFEHRMIQIGGTLKDARLLMPDGQAVVRKIRNDPKTKESFRKLPVTDALTESLVRQQMRQNVCEMTSGNRWVGSEYVVTTTVGTPYSLSNLRKKYETFLKNIGVRYIRLHDLRHTVAKVSLNEGKIPIEQTSQALGHSRIDTTKRIYARSVPRYNDEFIEAMSNILPAASTPNPSESGGAHVEITPG